MSWLFFGILAQIVLGTSAVFDKLILRTSVLSPLAYTVWLGLLGMVAVVLLPFGGMMVSLPIIGLGIFAGACFIIGMFFYFVTLDKARAGGSIVAIAGFSPIATLVFSSFLLGTNLELYQEISFALLLFGGMIIAFLEERGVRLWALWYGLVAAGFLGFSYVVTKIVFEESNFVTGFFWTKVGGALVSVVILAIPRVRERIMRIRSSPRTYTRWYILNRAYAGVGSVLVFYAISLGEPPLVNALESLRFLIVFIMGWVLLHTRVRLKLFMGEFTAFTLISLAVIFLGVGDYARTTVPDRHRDIMWGVTFSQKFSTSFDFGSGKTWQDNYDALLDDLRVRHFRLIAYWDLLEAEKGVYDFSGLDYQMNRARDAGSTVVLVIGRKLPRWPECHDPSWARSLDGDAYTKELRAYMREVVLRYKDNPALRYWQVENEPFLGFGECPTVPGNVLVEEIALVRSLDNSHPILTTDSGELGRWIPAARMGDVFGTTMYRRVHNDIIGYFDYHLPPAFFRLKEGIARLFVKNNDMHFIVIELAAEPWMVKQLYETEPRDQYQFFDEAFFKDSIQYARDTGFDEYYLWGAEWWYWLRVRHDNPVFWDIAKSLFHESI